MAYVVIGANWGDEGKGLMTDYLCARDGIEVVVRFNGGAQAGHTVVTPGGIRHVFHHFGSGTLQGCATFLSSFFVSNPALFWQEHIELEEKGFSPIVYADPDGLVTTPWDMMLNQARETFRGTDRHGSCGVGFNETIARSQQRGHVLRIAHLYQSNLPVRLARIRDALWLDAERLGADKELWHDGALLTKFQLDCDRFAYTIDAAPAQIKGLPRRPMLFEGAQGLKLDMDDPDFPYVTRSKTGIFNAVRLAKDMGIDNLTPVYVSRTYFTRHGAGPLPQEWSDFQPLVNDNTNVAHPWQGALRYAPFNGDSLAARIRQDLMWRPVSRPEIAITHTDQMDIPFVNLDLLLSQIEARQYYVSDGPTRKNVSVRMHLRQC